MGTKQSANRSVNHRRKHTLIDRSIDGFIYSVRQSVGQSVIHSFTSAVSQSVSQGIIQASVRRSASQAVNLAGKNPSDSPPFLQLWSVSTERNGVPLESSRSSAHVFAMREASGQREEQDEVYIVI